jgi:23S rRNA pseudouridine1911/1915/1917 synthase
MQTLAAAERQILGDRWLTLANSTASEVSPTSEVLFDDPFAAETDEEDLVTLTVAEPAGERLDRWLVSQLPDRSRAEIQRWIEAGQVTLAGKPLKASYRVAAGDALDVIVPAAEAYTVEPEPIPLDVLYEDDDLLVINKAAGMVVHPAAGNWHGTVVNAVLHHCPDLAGVGGAQRPGIVHRLDRDTSGALLVAKNDAAHRALQEQFQARQVEKTYLALVYGQMTPPQGEIQAAIGRDPHDRKRMAVTAASHGRPAVTCYETLAVYRAASGERLALLACRPLTGRTHQIRVHLAHVKHPIVGDPVYAGRRQPAVVCPRQFLHAQQISFRLPATAELVTFSAPLPADLQRVLALLEGTQPPVAPAPHGNPGSAPRKPRWRPP